MNRSLFTVTLAITLGSSLMTGCQKAQPGPAPNEVRSVVVARDVTIRPDGSLNIPFRPTGGELTAVTDTYGPLSVVTGNFEAKANHKAWSSWWYPIADDYLFTARGSELSPLQKYDRLMQLETATNPGAAKFEKESIYDAHAVAWAGLCDAWAIASIMEEEPTHPLDIDGIHFKVADLKALLLKTYDGVQGLKQFGQRFNGTWDAYEYPDIYADQFHKFIQTELFEKKKPFVMDRDPGVEVWNTPVYRAQTQVDADPSRNDTLHVHTWLFTASSDVKDYSFVGTEEIVRDYTYDLFGKKGADGLFHVTYGVWTGRSRWDHPDYVSPKPDQVKRIPLNPQLDVGTVDELISRSLQASHPTP